MRSFVQVSAQVKLDLIADEAAEIMTSEKELSKIQNKVENKHRQKQHQQQKNLDMNQLSLDQMVMEKVRAESAAVARQQMQVQAMTEAYEQEYMPKAAEIVEEATKDVGEGAEKRKNADAFAWAQIDAASYNTAFQEGIGSDVLVQGQTIRDGMENTGGYIGTDMDENLN